MDKFRAYFNDRHQDSPQINVCCHMYTPQL
jgi:hypothetical protein